MYSQTDNFPPGEQIIEGVVESIIYSNDANSYSVFVVVYCDDRDGGILKELTCTAYSQVAEGEDVKLAGYFVVHPSYGLQFKVSTAERIMPKDVMGMEKYLASGAIKGIGAKRAKLIVEKFGLETFSVIEHSPEKLKGIGNITEKLAKEIGLDFADKSAQVGTMMYLQGLGLTAGQSEKIYKRYAHESVDIVKQNPYVLAEEIFGIGFKIADSIAAKAGIPHSSPYRISAGVKYVLTSALGEGHVYLPKVFLVYRAAEILFLEEAEIENHIIQMQADNEIKQDKILIVNENGDETGEIVVYLGAYYHSEIYAARKLLELNMQTQTYNNADNDIKAAEKEIGITLADLQKEAVAQALTNGVMVITGGPGTGKTTTINTIIHIMKSMGKTIVLCAPTGRAAKRMSEATGMPASTIHRLLGIFSAEAGAGTPRFLNNEDLPKDSMIQEDCIIVDESSMVDIMLMFRLLKSIKAGTSLILVGDANQLPSVGPGNVLRDIIASGKIKTVYLDEIFRQSRMSAIVMNAHRINAGTYPILNEKSSDFFFISEHDINKVINTVANLAAFRLPKYMDADPIKDIQVLTPQRKSATGVANLNILLQNALNPPAENKAEKQMGSFIFRQGDKVMQVKNNYALQWRMVNALGQIAEEGVGIFNGDEGIVEHIYEDERIMQVRFDDDRLCDYEFSQLDELVLAYAITIHKSQGSEYDIVILPIHSGPPMLLNRNLLYTAITRAKKLVVVVGIANTLHRMVDNMRENVRYSSLKYRIIRLDR